MTAASHIATHATHVVLVAAVHVTHLAVRATHTAAHATWISHVTVVHVIHEIFCQKKHEFWN